MDEMLTSIIGDTPSIWTSNARRAVQNPQVLDTLSRIGVDLIYGDTIAEAQPLDLLLNTAIHPLTVASRGYTRYAVARRTPRFPALPQPATDLRGRHPGEALLN